MIYDCPPLALIRRLTSNIFINSLFICTTFSETDGYGNEMLSRVNEGLGGHLQRRVFFTILQFLFYNRFSSKTSIILSAAFPSHNSGIAPIFFSPESIFLITFSASVKLSPTRWLVSISTVIGRSVEFLRYWM
jgi:hypothetical protein